jgi:hypothetical protein
MTTARKAAATRADLDENISILGLRIRMDRQMISGAIAQQL